MEVGGCVPIAHISMFEVNAIQELIMSVSMGEVRVHAT